jgi:uncharacterized protein YceH (UPF0502 family)
MEGLVEALLSEAEARVLGCLVEKELTTPDYYPISLNALCNACNQKSNRDPVVSYDETAVVRSMDRLREKGLATMVQKFDSRVPKYQHELWERWGLSHGEMAVVCELLLRGPQTPGELRNRGERMFRFSGIEEVERTLEGLMEREDQPGVVRLPKRPGRKEHRYMHLLCGKPEVEEEQERELAPEAARLKVHGEDERIREMRDELAGLRAELDTLKEEFMNFKRQFE